MRTDALTPRRRGLVLLAVLLLHLALLALLQRVWRGPPPPEPAQHRSTVRLITLALPPLRPAPAAPAPKGREATMASRLHMGPTKGPTKAPPPAPVKVPDAGAPAQEPPGVAADPSPAPLVTTQAPNPAASSPQRLLDSEATRRAIRQAATGPMLAERADQASRAPERVGPSGQLGAEIKKAGHGDCLKGEYAGGGMGLLSAPFWLLAEVRGKCAK